MVSGNLVIELRPVNVKINEVLASQVQLGPSPWRRLEMKSLISRNIPANNFSTRLLGGRRLLVPRGQNVHQGCQIKSCSRLAIALLVVLDHFDET